MKGVSPPENSIFNEFNEPKSLPFPFSIYDNRIPRRIMSQYRVARLPPSIAEGTICATAYGQFKNIV